MLLQIESVKLSKSGRSYWVVTTSGKGYSSKAPGIEQTAGRAIEAQVNQFKMGNDMVDGIETFTFVDGPEQAPMPGPASVAAAMSDRYWLPFVSNQVAHAIQAGLIKTPGDMDAWAKAAYAAVNNADDVEF